MPELRRSEELLAHTEWLTRLARSLVREPADAEDAVQDTLVAALAAGRADVERPRAWLAMVLTNLVRKRARGDERRRAREELRGSATVESGPAELVERAIAQQDLIQAVVSLEEPDRSTLLRHYFDGASASEIARSEGTTAANIRQRLTRARRRLRARMEEKDRRAHLLLLAGRTRHAPSAAVVAGAILTAGALIWLAAVGVRSHATSVRTPGQAIAASASTPVEAVLASEPEPSPTRSTAADPPPVVGRAISVHARYAADGSDAAGTIVLVRSLDPASPFPIDVAKPADEHGVARFEDLPCVETRVGHLQRGDDYRWIDVRPGADTSVDLEVPLGVTVEGVVVDGEERPIGDAEIWLSECWQSVRGHVAARTDAQGSFRIRDVQLDGLNWLSARAPGLVPSSAQAFEGVVPGGTVPLRICLERPGGALALELVDASGAPIENALILVGKESDEAARRAGGSPPRLLVTDASGKARVDGLARGATPIQARSAKTGFWRGQVEIHLFEETHARIVLPPAASVVGRAEATLVHAFGKDGFLAASARPDADGNFRLSGLGAGRIPLAAEGPGGRRAVVELDLRPGEEREWSPHLVAVARIAGTLRDGHGNPAAGRELVSFVGASAEWSERSDVRWAETDAEGRFAYEDLGEGPRTLVATDPDFDFPPVVLRGVVPSIEPLDVRIPLADLAGTIAVEVVDGAGSPVDDVRLHILDPLTLHAEDLRSEVPQAAWQVRARAGRYVLEIQSGAHPRVFLGERWLAAGARLDLGRVVLGDASFVRGTLRSRLQLEIVWLDDARRPLGSTRLVGDRYESPPLAAGRCILSVRGSEGGRCEQTLEVPGGRDLDLDLEVRLESRPGADPALTLIATPR